VTILFLFFSFELFPLTHATYSVKNVLHLFDTFAYSKKINTSPYNTLTFTVRFRVSNRVRVRVRVRFRVRVRVRDRVRVSVQGYIAAVIEIYGAGGRYDFPDGRRITACVNNE